MPAAFPDTSFLFSLYLPRPSSGEAARIFCERNGPLPISSLLVFEFENAVRLATWLHRQDKDKGSRFRLRKSLSLAWKRTSMKAYWNRRLVTTAG